MPRASLLALALLSGCFEGTPPLDASVIDANRSGYTIEVRTLPGLKVRVGSDEWTADGDGLASGKISLDRLSYMGQSTSLPVQVLGRSGLTDMFATTELTLPFSPEEGKRLPEGDAWLRVLHGASGAPQGEHGTVMGFKDVGGLLLSEDGSAEVHLLAPPGAEVGFGGQTGVAGPDGHWVVQLTTDEVLALIPAGAARYGSVGSPAPTLEAWVKPARGARVDLPLTPTWLWPNGKLFRGRFEAVAQRPFPGSRAVEALAIYVSATDDMMTGGVDRPLSQVDVVLLGKAGAQHEMAPCEGYYVVREGQPQDGPPQGEPISLERKGLDEEVVAYDAHTGAELGRQQFFADALDCPVQRNVTSPTYVAAPKAKDILAWGLGLVPSTP